MSTWRQPSGEMWSSHCCDPKGHSQYINLPSQTMHDWLWGWRGHKPSKGICNFIIEGEESLPGLSPGNPLNFVSFFWSSMNFGFSQANVFAQLYLKPHEQQVGVTALPSALSVSLLLYRACAWCAVCSTWMLGTWKLYFKSWVMVLLHFPSGQSSYKAGSCFRKQGTQGHLPGSTSWVLPGWFINIIYLLKASLNVTFVFWLCHLVEQWDIVLCQTGCPYTAEKMTDVALSAWEDYAKDLICDGKLLNVFVFPSALLTQDSRSVWLAGFYPLNLSHVWKHYFSDEQKKKHPCLIQI